MQMPTNSLAPIPLASVRAALCAIPKKVAQHGPDLPELEHVYVVRSHLAALDPDSVVVVGDRGVGKSFWSACLNSAPARALIGQELQSRYLENLEVAWGFSTAGTSTLGHPTKRVLRSLSAQGFDAQTVWRTVILHQLGKGCGLAVPGEEWADRVTWVAASPEREEQRLHAVSQRLGEQGKRGLVVFDALDRMGDTWDEIRALVRGLLQVSLDLLGHPAIRVKLFMRSDMWGDERIWNFRDASKLRHGKVALQWRKVELYGLLWHWLANHEDSSSNFRAWCEAQFQLSFHKLNVGEHIVYGASQALQGTEDLQMKIFSQLASPFMGRNHRKGRTYSWLPNHLADAKGQVSPRSFLAALRVAAEASEARNAVEVLHFEAIKTGVQEASSIRVDELSEDYPWIRPLLDALGGMSVPCDKTEILARWTHAKVLARIERDIEEARQQGNEHLPPHVEISERAPGSEEGKQEELLGKLVEIGVVSIGRDGRVNMPDLFRVASGIGRRGGVRAIR